MSMPKTIWVRIINGSDGKITVHPHQDSSEYILKSEYDRVVGIVRGALVNGSHDPDYFGKDDGNWEISLTDKQARTILNEAKQ